MFIDPDLVIESSPVGAKHCAPNGADSIIKILCYRHLAPLEPGAGTTQTSFSSFTLNVPVLLQAAAGVDFLADLFGEQVGPVDWRQT